MRDLCTAGRIAKANPNHNSKDHQRYRRFVFNTAFTMVHECGHIFINFLTQGRSRTPPSMPSGRPGALVGEAGDALEDLLFGGIYVVTRNTDENEAQVCLNMCSSTKRVAYELTNALVWRPSLA